jgi:toxin ParE1/3/4
MSSSYILSKKADQDVKEIFKHSYTEFGESQAYKYLDGLEASFEMLVENPLLGRNCDWLREGYHRHEYASHVIFYKPRKKDIFISRILHKRMDAKKHL